MVRIVSAIIAILLFIFNYQICEIVYPHDIEAWWGLKQNIYNIIIAAFSIIALKEAYGILKSLMVFTIILTIGNVVDRIIFDINTFEENDWLLIFFGLIISWRCRKE